MFKLNPLLITDGYKLDHRSQYPEDTEVVYSNGTPRSNKIFQQTWPKHDGKYVAVGMEATVLYFIKELFDENFFKQDRDDVCPQYKEVVEDALGPGAITLDHVYALHDLGYLPIIIKALPEGTVAKIKVPFLTIKNTLPEFFWVTNYLETLLSAVTWKPITNATIAREFRILVDEYAELTGCSDSPTDLQCHDFSMRGLSFVEDSVFSSLGHMTYFNGTDSMPVKQALKYFYDADPMTGVTVPATEHSVMCMGSKDKEIDTFERLLKLYPAGIVSIVSDTWDFWKVLTSYTVLLKELIESREDITDADGNVLVPGRTVFRPDCYDEETKILTPRGWVFFKDLKKEDKVAQVLDDGSYEWVTPMKITKQYYEGEMCHFHDHHGKIDLLVTPNHRMIVEQVPKNGNPYERVILAEDLGKYGAARGNSSQRMSRSAPAREDDTVLLSNLERLKIAFQADGSYVTKSKTKIRFNFSKQRKIDRLKNLLEGFDYKLYHLKDGRTEIHIEVGDASNFTKDLSWVDTASLSKTWCEEFIEELSYWDATRRTDTRFKFDTTVKSVVEVVELVAIGAGYGVFISEREDTRSDKFSNVYTAHLTKNNKIGGQARRKSKVDYKGNVYCVTVPTGRLLVKRNKGTMVCGNSGDPVKILTGYKPSEYLESNGSYYCRKTGKELAEHEVKGAVEVLYDIFGGSETENGFKVLNSSVGLIYGDSITLHRCEAIMARLAAKGFASCNVVFGIGSYTYQYNTRDTLGIAFKATAGTRGGEHVELFKDPKTDSGTKKSAKGYLKVIDGELYDQQPNDDGGDLEVIFKNGKMVRKTSWNDVRMRAML